MELEIHRLERRYEELRIAHGGGRLMASLAEHGQQVPVTVIVPSPSAYVLVDGYRRVAALSALGRDTVEALVLPLGEAEALLWRFRVHTAGQRSALEEAWLLTELCSAHGLSQAELARRLSRSESWVSRRLDLVRVLPESVQALVQRGRLCAHGAQRCLVPLARAKRADCERLAEGLAGHQVTSRQLQRLWAAWRAGDREQRERIVERPLLFFEALAESEKPEPASPDVALAADLELLAAVGRRLRRRVGQRSVRLPLPVEFINAWSGARGTLQGLLAAVEGLLHAGSGHSDGGPAPRA